jgi:hypothetical protein
MRFCFGHELRPTCNFNDILYWIYKHLHDLRNDDLASMLRLIIPANFNGILALNPST